MIALSPTPVLDTDRLHLRAPLGSDWPHWQAFHMSDRARHVGGGPDLAAGQSWRAFGHIIGHWAMRGFGMFVFTRKDDPKPLGLTGPWFPDGWPEPELGWQMWSKDTEGTGLMAEAATAARHHAFATLGWTTAVSYIASDNARSIALAHRLNATRDTAATPPASIPACHVYRHPALAAS